MSLKEQAFSALIVSASEKFSLALSSMLSEQSCSRIRTAKSIAKAKSFFSDGDYDYVIINSPLPDDAGIEFAEDVCSSKSSVALLLLGTELYSEIRDKVSAYGVFTLKKPLSRLTMSQAINFMEAARERLRRMERNNLSIEEKMKEIRIVNRAKWLLISEIKMDEASAHRYIEKQAMDRCISKKAVAEEIIRTYG